METLGDFSKVKVLIVGDVMIDRYWWGSVERISPEAPVPVVRLNDTTLIAGGAANVAANVAGLGAEPYLVGIVGEDEEAQSLSKLLVSRGIDPEYLLKTKSRPTTVKTRILAHSQQIARIDRESNSDITLEEEAKALSKIEHLIDKTDIVLVSDYAKGFLTTSFLERLITNAKKNGKLVLVDPKGKSFSKYKNADIITPNQREVAEACGLERVDCRSIEKYGKKLIKELNLQSLLVTRGENGMMLLENKKKPLALKALAREVYDVTGAGDTVIATLAVAVSKGLDVPAAAELANIAAGLVVEQVGTTAIKYENLREASENYSNKQT